MIVALRVLARFAVGAMFDWARSRILLGSRAVAAMFDGARSRVLLASLALLVASCSSPERASFAPNGEADRFAVLELDEAGHLVRATGILPFSADRGVSVYRTSGARAVAVGWRSEVLALRSAPSADALAEARLEAANGCVQRLPAPAIAVDLEGGASIDPTTLPPLTASWLGDVCPEVTPGDLSVDLECKLFRCPLTVTPKTRCTLDLELDCELGRFEGTLAWDGSLCLEAIEPLECAALPTDAHEAATYACAEPNACVLHAYVAPPPLPLDVRDVKLADLEPFSASPDFVGELLLPLKQGRFVGYAYDFAVADGRAFVSLGPSTTPFDACPSDLRSGQLARVDAETLELEGTIDAPPCLTRLAPLAAPGSPFIGLHVAREAFMLTRFDRDGAAVDTLPAEPRTSAGPNEVPILRADDGRPTVLEVVDDPPRLVFAVALAARPATEIVVYDGATLAVLSRAIFEDTVVVAASVVDPRTILLADAQGSRALWLDLPSTSVKTSVALPRETDRYDNFASDVTWVGAANKALLTFSRKNAAIYGLDEVTGVRSRAVVFDDDTRPIAALAFAPSSPLVLVGSVRVPDQTSWPGALSIYDAERARFRAGHVLIGRGPPGRMTRDERGRTWVLFPWEPRLVRVTLTE